MRLLLFVCTCLASGVIAPMSASAQTGEAARGETETLQDTIVVTARRREESLKDVPLVIQVSTGSQLQERGVVTVTDLQFAFPGVQTTPSSRSNSTPFFTLRGLGQRDTSPATDPAVGLYFAEVPIARPNGFNGSLFDMQNVQVLKGPQGTLFGRNTVGGAILFTPNAPTGQLGGSAQIQAGNYGLRDFEGVLNLPIAQGIKLRVSGKITRRDGYLKDMTPLSINGVPFGVTASTPAPFGSTNTAGVINLPFSDRGHRANSISNEAVRVSLRLEPLEGLTSDFIGSYFHSFDDGTAQKLILANPSRFPIASQRPVFAALADAALHLGNYEYFDLPYFNNDGTKQVLFSRTDMRSIQNATSYKISDYLTVKNIASYRSTEAAGTFNLGGLPINLVATNALSNFDQVTEELQLQGNSTQFKWVVGLFYFRESGSDISQSNQFSSRETINANSNVRNVSKSVFGHFDYSPDFLQGFTLSAGIRYNRDQRRTTIKPRTPTVVGGASLYRCTFEPGVVTTASTNGVDCPSYTNAASFSKVTYDISLSYKITPELTGYATHRRGYRSGTVYNRPSSLAAFFNPTRPDVVDDFEVGAKSDFAVGDMRGRVNLAYFHSNYKNAQRSISGVDPALGTLVSNYVNAATAKIDGIDVDATLVVSRRLTLNAAYTHLHARYSSFFDSASIPGTGVVVPIDISDSDFPFAPNHVLTLGARFQIPVADRLGRPSLQANYYWQSDFDTADVNTSNCGPSGIYAQCLNNAPSRLAGYSLLNLRADWDNFMNGPVDLALFVNNVTNKYYYTGANAQFNSIGTTVASVGAPRMYGVEVRVHF